MNVKEDSLEYRMHPVQTAHGRSAAGIVAGVPARPATLQLRRVFHWSISLAHLHSLR